MDRVTRVFTSTAPSHDYQLGRAKRALESSSARPNSMQRIPLPYFYGEHDSLRLSSDGGNAGRGREALRLAAQSEIAESDRRTTRRARQTSATRWRFVRHGGQGRKAMHRNPTIPMAGGQPFVLFGPLHAWIHTELELYQGFLTDLRGLALPTAFRIWGRAAANYQEFIDAAGADQTRRFIDPEITLQLVIPTAVCRWPIFSTPTTMRRISGQQRHQVSATQGSGTVGFGIQPEL